MLVDHIAWQLDNPTAAALGSDALPVLATGMFGESCP